MNAKECDRCGRFYDEYNTKGYHTEPNTLMLIQEQEKDFPYCTKKYDLCPECMAELQEWLQKGDKK